VIFISHAAVDADLAEHLVNLLDSGAGVPADEIFCSSAAGNVPNSELFVEHILGKLNTADLVVAIISRAYLNSRFCLAEVGAALVRKIDGKAKFYSLIVPPLTFSELDGALYGRQAGKIIDRPALSELREAIMRSGKNLPPLPVWDRRCEAFLRFAPEAVGRIEADELSRRIILQDVCIERSALSSINYKSKLRVTLENGTGKKLSLDSSLWVEGTGGVAWRGPKGYLVWQVAVGKDWTEQENQSLEIPPGKNFRTWVGLEESVTDKEILRRCALRQLGALEANIRIGQHGTVFRLQL
jgi:hypothetical protein